MNATVHTATVPRGRPRSSPAESSPPDRPGTLTDTDAPALLVRQCSDCGRDMVTQPAYTRDPTLRETYVCYGGRGMCRGCYSLALYHRSSGPVERQRLYRDTDACSSSACSECHSLTTTHRRLRNDPQRYVGYRRYGGYGMCQPCYCRAKRRGTLPDPASAAYRARLTAGPLDPAELARLRADLGVGPGTERHAEGEVMP